MTVATVIYYSGYHPYTLRPTFTPKAAEEKRDQHRFFFWYKRENHRWIKNVLSKANRQDLINQLLSSAAPDGKKSSKKSNPQGRKNKSDRKNFHKNKKRRGPKNKR